MNQDLTRKKCVPCEGGVPPLLKEDAEAYLALVPAWSLVGKNKAIRIEFVMKDFMAAIKLIEEVAEIAEAEDHHPDFHLVGYRKLSIELSTHAIGGLSENDFIVAAKIDQLPKQLKEPFS